MLIVHVHVHVKPESVADFRQALIENVRSSRREGRDRREYPISSLDDRYPSRSGLKADSSLLSGLIGQFLRQTIRYNPA